MLKNLCRACLSFLFLVVATSFGLAQQIYSSPEYFAVAGVASDDVLNIRSGPTASADLVGFLTHDAVPVEVIFQRDGWGYVSKGESSGYVSMAFLSPISLSNLADTPLPQSMVCGGTEPFWDVDFEGNRINFSLFGELEMDPVIIEADGFSGVGPSQNYLLAQGENMFAMGVVRNRICSDGMSDRDYAREIDLVFMRGGQTTAYSGCCSVNLLE